MTTKEYLAIQETYIQAVLALHHKVKPTRRELDHVEALRLKTIEASNELRQSEKSEVQR